MATREYWFAFGSGNPTTNTGLAPTFIFFVNGSGNTIAPPSVTETYVGTGLYKANYQATQTIAFILDGATSGLVASDRYISGVMDPYDLFGVTLSAVSITLVAQGATLVAIGNTGIALGTTAVALGTSGIALGTTAVALGTTAVALGNTAVAQGSGLALLIGTTASSYGSTAIDPGDLFGYLKRARELSEGNQLYTKATGILDLYVRGGVTLIAEKTITDTATTTTKS